MATNRRPPLVLCYHAISDAWPDPLAVSPKAFERQLRALVRRGFRSVSADEILSRRGRLLHVTFDDAYRNVQDVLPLLRRMGLHATLFVCSGFADDGAPLLIPELRARAAGYENELATMDWDELRAAAAAGVEVGSHTVSHAHLPALSDDELRRELGESRERIGDELGRACRLLAYPFGENDRRVRSAAAAAGYTAAFALRPPVGAAPDAFALPRADVYHDDGVVRFALKTSMLRKPILSALDRKRAQAR